MCNTHRALYSPPFTSSSNAKLKTRKKRKGRKALSVARASLKTEGGIVGGRGKGKNGRRKKKLWRIM